MPASHTRHLNAVSPPFKHGSIRYGRTASAADRAVLIELRRFLAVIYAIRTPLGQHLQAEAEAVEVVGCCSAGMG